MTVLASFIISTPVLKLLGSQILPVEFLRKVSYTCASSVSSYLVLSLQHQKIGNLAKWQAKPNDLSLINVVGQLANVDDT